MRNYDDYSMETIKSRVYNALAEISFEEDASEDQMTRAIEWFQIHFYDQEPEPKEYHYGMRIRGYSIGCQPTDGLLRREDDHSGDYYDILVYDHKLTENETRAYSLDRI